MLVVFCNIRIGRGLPEVGLILLLHIFEQSIVFRLEVKLILEKLIGNFSHS